MQGVPKRKVVYAVECLVACVVVLLVWSQGQRQMTMLPEQSHRINRPSPPKVEESQTILNWQTSNESLEGVYFDSVLLPCSALAEKDVQEEYRIFNEAVEHAQRCKDKHSAIVLKHFSSSPGAPQAYIISGSVVLLIPATLPSGGEVNFGTGGNRAWAHISDVHAITPDYRSRSGTLQITRDDEKMVEGDLNLMLEHKWDNGTVQTAVLTGTVRVKPAVSDSSDNIR